MKGSPVRVRASALSISRDFLRLCPCGYELRVRARYRSFAAGLADRLCGVDAIGARQLADDVAVRPRTRPPARSRGRCRRGRPAQRQRFPRSRSRVAHPSDDLTADHIVPQAFGAEPKAPSESKVTVGAVGRRRRGDVALGRKDDMGRGLPGVERHGGSYAFLPYRSTGIRGCAALPQR